MGGKTLSMPDEPTFLDAGVFIGALLQGDPRHREARPLVDAARRGEWPTCTSAGILSEVYAALTWVGALPPHSPAEASRAVAVLVAPPSAIHVLEDGLGVSLLTLRLAAEHTLTARRIHDARHAATALHAGVSRVYTYDPGDWQAFAANGIAVVGPPSILSSPSSSTAP